MEIRKSNTTWKFKYVAVLLRSIKSDVRKIKCVAVLLGRVKSDLRKIKCVAVLDF